MTLYGKITAAIEHADSALLFEEAGRRGHASLKHHGSATGLDLVQGQSVVVPATAPRYAITGEAAFCRARVPEAPLLPSSDPAQRVSHGVV